ncbi:MAG TPA: hypothetical protein VKP60_07525 [Magnetospirillaceae bacterium]|nr:hypothetical protein [Magnetospirillaceae bacterium]
MGPLSRFRLRLTALLVMLPRTALAQKLYPSGAGPFLSALTGGEIFVDVAVGLFLVTIALVSVRRLVRSAPGVAMARLAMAAPGGSAQSGALRAAAGGGSHALPAAAPAVSRAGTGKTDGKRSACLAVRRRS